MTAADPTRPDAVAQLVGVTKSFGATRALDGVDLTLGRGESRALVGRNGAGKSTLVAVLTGLVAPDAGRVYLDGEPAPPVRARELWSTKVACVYQHPKIVPALTVAENLFLGRLPRARSAGPGSQVVGWKGLRERARAELDAWGIEVDETRAAERLSVEEAQLVEIVRALSQGTRCMILDEPTARLEKAAIGRLFDRLAGLRESGISFLYISHHLDEIYEVCESVTVLRNGAGVLDAPVATLPRTELIGAMLGDDERGGAAPEVRAAAETPEGAGLEVVALAARGSFQDVGFQVAAGEVVGLAGHRGSGNRQVAEALLGAIDRQGEVRVAGRVLPPGRVHTAIQAGVGYVPGDRHRQGLVPALGVDDNIGMPRLYGLRLAGLISPATRRRLAERLIELVGVVPPRPSLPVGGLSGGNQQKVVLGRALSTDPRVLVLVHPTAGVDVASREAIFAKIREACGRGAAALVVSDEVEELQVCDRVLAMFEGRIVAEFREGWRDRDVVEAMEGGAEAAVAKETG